MILHNYYYQIHQLDGRIENHHLCVEDEQIYIDLKNDTTGKVKSLVDIPGDEFAKKSEKAFKVLITQDDGDGSGPVIGYLEHYEL